MEQVKIILFAASLITLVYGPFMWGAHIDAKREVKAVSLPFRKFALLVWVVSIACLIAFAKVLAFTK